MWRADLQDEQCDGDGDDRIAERDDPRRAALHAEPSGVSSNAATADARRGRLSYARGFIASGSTRSSTTNPVQQRVINDGKYCQMLAGFPLVGATIGPIHVDLRQAWVFGGQ